MISGSNIVTNTVLMCQSMYLFPDSLFLSLVRSLLFHTVAFSLSLNGLSVWLTLMLCICMGLGLSSLSRPRPRPRPPSLLSLLNPQRELAQTFKKYSEDVKKRTENIETMDESQKLKMVMQNMPRHQETVSQVICLFPFVVIVVVVCLCLSSNFDLFFVHYLLVVVVLVTFLGVLIWWFWGFDFGFWWFFLSCLCTWICPNVYSLVIT